MADRVSDNFIALLRTELCGEGADELRESLHGLSRKELSEIVTLAKKHDLFPLVAHLLASPNKTKEGNSVSLSLSSNIAKKLNAVYLKYVGVCEKQFFEISSIRSALEKAQIPFILLKGAVMRSFYPKSWMRTSSDIDVLVHECDLDGAVFALTDALGYTCNAYGVKGDVDEENSCYESVTGAVKGTHDVQLSAPSGICVELHFRLIEEYRYPLANEYLDAVWDYSRLKPDHAFEYVLSDDIFIFYHIAHMVKHFETGGCGVRFFCDLYFINKHFGAPSDTLRDMLKKAGFMCFYETASLLASRWFDDVPAPTLDEFADFILSLGTFGSRENLVAVRQSKRGGRFKYLFHRVFMPYDMLIVNYPFLKGRKYFTPLYEMRRWFDIIFGGRASKAAKEIGASLASDASEREKMLRLISLTGLK